MTMAQHGVGSTATVHAPLHELLAVTCLWTQVKFVPARAKTDKDWDTSMVLSGRFTCCCLCLHAVSDLLHRAAIKDFAIGLNLLYPHIARTDNTASMTMPLPGACCLLCMLPLPGAFCLCACPMALGAKLCLAGWAAGAGGLVVPLTGTIWLRSSLGSSSMNTEWMRHHSKKSLQATVRYLVPQWLHIGKVEEAS